MKNNKHAFLYALIFTIVIFIAGLIFGFALESSRADKAELELISLEVDLLDEQLRNDVVRNFDLSCDVARESMFDFADNVYESALQLEQYDAASKFDGTLEILHKRYDLLRMILWQESIEFSENCPGDFHRVVYFFEYDTNNIDVKAEQLFYSRMLLDLKRKHTKEVLLIPIAGNLELDSIDLVLDNFGIRELPSVVIDEDQEKVIRGVVKFEELEEIVFE